MIEVESGYIGEAESSCYVRSAMSDVEIIRVSSSNIIARGRRYGRYWLLKGLREELQGSTLMRRRLMKEFEIHSRLLNPAVAQAVALEEIEGLGLCIVEEWVDGKTLAELIRKDALSKPDKRRIMREIIKATAYLHGKGVVHRDLKPSNIMVREAGGEAVLIDFGLADTDDYAEIKQPAGTEGFISPEQRLSGGAETSDDVYSLGVIMLELCREYGSIARKCIGSVERRPKDAGALLKALDSHDRKPKKIAVSVISLFITTLVLFAAIHIKTLSEASEFSEKQVANITEENSNNARLVAELSDSLNIVSNRMKKAEKALQSIEEYNQSVENAFKEGHRQIDNTLDRYDRYVFSRFTPEDHEDYAKAWSRMNNELFQIADCFSKSTETSGLTPNDREKVRLDMVQYYTVKLPKYQEKWTKRIFPTYHQNS